MIKDFIGSHSTTINYGAEIRANGFKPSSESFRVCSGTYFWNDDPENNPDLLTMLANHWYQNKRQRANNHNYPESDIIYAKISSEHKYILDLTHPKIRISLVKLSERLEQFDPESKCNIYAHYLGELEEEKRTELNDKSFEFKVILTIEAIPSKVKFSKALPFFVKEAKILVVRSGHEKLISIIPKEQIYTTAY